MHADFDDNMFDPSRAQNHGPVDLADNGPQVEPFYTPGVASTAQHSPEMSQYPQSQAATSEGGYPAYGAQNVSRGPSSASSGGFAGRGAGMSQPTTPFPMPTIPAGMAAGAGAGAGAAAGDGMSAKQREAYQEQQRFRVHNQAGPGPSGGSPMSPSGTSGSGGPVTVHEDGGAAGEEDAGATLGSEIPPTYDSIRR